MAEQLEPLRRKGLHYPVFARLLRNCLLLVEHTSEALPLILEAKPVKTKKRYPFHRGSETRVAKRYEEYAAWDRKVRSLLDWVDPCKIGRVQRFHFIHDVWPQNAWGCLRAVGFNLAEILPDADSLTRRFAKRTGRINSHELADIKVTLGHVQSHALDMLPRLVSLADPEPWVEGQEDIRKA